MRQWISYQFDNGFFVLEIIDARQCMFGPFTMESMETFLEQRRNTDHCRQDAASFEGQFLAGQLDAANAEMKQLKKENAMNSTRRNIAIGLVAAPLVACSGGVPAITSVTIAAWIQQIQAGVAKACSVAGAVVPEANAVIALITSLAGGNIAAVTAATIAQAITSIVGAACPAPTQFKLGDPMAPTGVTVNGVPITFIKFK